MTDIKVLLPEVRLSYPHLFRPSEDSTNDKGEMVKGKYGAVGILDPKNPKHKKAIKVLSDAIKEVAKEKWGDNIPKTVMPLRTNCCLRDGADKNGAEFDEMYTVSASSRIRPPVVGKKTSQVIEEDDDIVYGGAYVHMKVSLWAMDNDWGKRVNCNLVAVQFVRDGNRFGSTPAVASEEFDDIEDDDDELFADELEGEIPF
jgi:hypothetical protein